MWVFSTAVQPILMSRSGLQSAAALMWSVLHKAPGVRMCVSLMALTQVTLPPERRSDAGSNSQQGADKTGYTK